MVQSGIHPVVEFGEGIEAQEGYLDPRMRGRIISVLEDRDDFAIFTVDLNGFEAHNKPLEQPNYYDRNGNPGLTATEANKLPKGGIEKLYLSFTETVSESFTLDQVLRIIDEESLSLYQEYLSEAPGYSYIVWLEKQVLASRTTA